MTENPKQIGTLRERPLHSDLKRWYGRPGDLVEHPVDGFVIDLFRDGLLIEIQTRSFSSIKRKIGVLLDAGHRVRIVHPIPVTKWIVKVEADGTIHDRRRSPKRGQSTDLFSELVSFPGLLADAPLEIEVVLIIEEEYRAHVPGKAWRRGGWVVMERRLVEIIDSSLFDTPDQLAGLLPSSLPEVFTTADLAKGLGRPIRSAQQMAYCLRELGLIAGIGKSGNSIEYRLASAAQ